MSHNFDRKKALQVGLALGLAAVVVAIAVVFSEDDTPSRDEPAFYTQHVVQRTIDLYDRDGRQATLDYVNSIDSVDGEWYPFVIEDGYTIAHHNPRFIRQDPSERVDSTGYFYGDDLLAATEEGRWVSYVFLNPDTGQEQRKHTWVVLHDGLLFGSGWYEASGAS